MALPRRPEACREPGGRLAVTMKQLHEKSGSMARLANFACDIRKAVSANTLPEYGLEITRNREGEEVVTMARRVLIGR